MLKIVVGIVWDFGCNEMKEEMEIMTLWGLILTSSPATYSNQAAKERVLIIINFLKVRNNLELTHQHNFGRETMKFLNFQKLPLSIQINWNSFFQSILIMKLQNHG